MAQVLEELVSFEAFEGIGDFEQVTDDVVLEGGLEFEVVLDEVLDEEFQRGVKLWDLEEFPEHVGDEELSGGEVFEEVGGGDVDELLLVGIVLVEVDEHLDEGGCHGGLEGGVGVEEELADQLAERVIGRGFPSELVDQKLAQPLGLRCCHQPLKIPHIQGEFRQKRLDDDFSLLQEIKDESLSDWGGLGLREEGQQLLLDFGRGRLLEKKEDVAQLGRVKGTSNRWGSSRGSYIWGWAGRRGGSVEGMGSSLSLFRSINLIIHPA